MIKQIELAALFLLLIFYACSHDISEFQTVNRCATIDPDYCDILIPPNIAPLNFRINAEGSAFKVLFRSGERTALKVSSTSGIIKLPMKKWKKFMNECRGGEWTIDIFVRDESGWKKYHLASNPRTVDYVIDHVLIYKPDFGDLDNLTGQIERGTLDFIRDVEGFLSNRGS